MTNRYAYRGDGLVRVERIEHDLTAIPLSGWTDDELGFRLAVLYPQIDGFEHLTAPEEVKTEVRRLMEEIKRRGFDPISNLMLNDRVVGFGWLPGFQKLEESDG